MLGPGEADGRCPCAAAATGQVPPLLPPPPTPYPPGSGTPAPGRSSTAAIHRVSARPAEPPNANRQQRQAGKEGAGGRTPDTPTASGLTPNPGTHTPHPLRPEGSHSRPRPASHGDNTRARPPLKGRHLPLSHRPSGALRAGGRAPPPLHRSGGPGGWGRAETGGPAPRRLRPSVRAAGGGAGGRCPFKEAKPRAHSSCSPPIPRCPPRPTPPGASSFREADGVIPSSRGGCRRRGGDLKQRNKNRRWGWGVRWPAGVAAAASAVTAWLGSVHSTTPPLALPPPPRAGRARAHSLRLFIGVPGVGGGDVMRGPL